MRLPSKDGRPSATDSVILMDRLRNKKAAIYGRDIKSTFNSLRHNKMHKVLEEHPGLQVWIGRFNKNLRDLREVDTLLLYW